MILDFMLFYKSRKEIFKHNLKYYKLININNHYIYHWFLKNQTINKLKYTLLTNMINKENKKLRFIISYLKLKAS